VANDPHGDGKVVLAESPRLTRHLWQVVRAKRRFLAARALVLAGLSCLSLAAAIVCTDVVLAFGPGARWLAFTFVLLAAVLVLAARLVRPWRRYGEHAAVRDLESACDGVGQLLRTSAEVAREGDAKAFSPALSQALVRQAEETLAAAPMARVIPWATLRRWGLALAVLILAFALAALLWPDFRRGALRLALPAAQVNFTHLEVAVSPEAFERGQTVHVAARLSGRPAPGVGLDLRLPRAGWVPTPMTQAADGAWSAEFAGLTQSFEIRLRAGDARSRHRVRFIDPPVVQSAAVQVEYPPYMRLPASSRPLEDLRLPVGAKARFTFALNHPLRRAAVLLPDGQRQDLKATAATLVWEWTVTPGRQAFNLVGEDAEHLPLRAFGWEVRGALDQRPQVTLLAPAEDISLTPLGETLIEARVQATRQQLERAATAQQPGAPQAAQAPPPPPEPLDHLAARAEALARAEQAVRNSTTPTPEASATPTPAAAPAAPPAPPAQDPATPQALAQATQQQQAAVQQAEALAADLRQNPRATPLANQRLAAAAETMANALRDLRAADPQAAAQELEQAQEQLETLATHLRGLDPARAAETLEHAALLAEAAARQLRPPPATALAQASAPPQSTPDAPEASAAAPVARNAETIDDWLKRLATEPAKGPEATRNPLREMRQELRTDTLADQVAQAAQDRQEGRLEQARQAERDAAERFEQMAKGLTQEHQRLARRRLEQLAAAESTAKALQKELDHPGKPVPGKETRSTAEQLREFASQLQDLRDLPLERAARDLREQVPAPNPSGPAPQDAKVPDRIRQETIPGTVTRLRTLIDEAVQRELLVDPDTRIPEQYNGLVESYFKALSDDPK
jgi:hypothetical protein